MTDLDAQQLEGDNEHIIPPTIAQSIVTTLDERTYCDFCCKPLTTAFQFSCNHVFCGECVMAIAQQENVDLQADTLRDAAESAYQDKPVTMSYMQLANSAMTMSQQARTYPQINCPMCLKQLQNLTSLNPNKRQASRLCQECGLLERAIRCAVCSSELCIECDAKLHAFATTKNHLRTPVANAGNSNSPVRLQLPCQAPHHRAIIQQALISGAPGAYNVSHPLYQESTAVQVASEYYVLEDRIQVCKFCAKSEFYKHKKVISANEAVELRVRELRQETDKCRQLVGEMRGLVYKYQECEKLDTNLHQIALAELHQVKDTILKVINEKFDGLEAELGHILEQRKNQSTTSQNSLHTVVGGMMNAVSSAEKHMLARQPSIFLQEFNQLIDNIRSGLRAVLLDLEKRPEPKRTGFPKIDEVYQLKQFIDSIQLNKTQLFVEQVGLNTKQNILCKDCNCLLIKNTSNLRQVAKKQKGCLYGIQLESIEPDAICLDTIKGTPGSRHVICKQCGRELGRWSQPDAVDKKFTPGFVFISTNVVK